VDLTRAEVDRMLQRADELRTKLRRATRELARFGEDVMAEREAGRTVARDPGAATNSDADRSQQ